MSYIIVIGSSTGGPSTLEKFFKTVTEPINAPILIAQHLTFPYTTILAKRLNNISKIPVSEIKSGDLLENEHAYVIPGNSHFLISHPGPKIALIPSQEILTPSVDMGLTSAAEHYGPKTIAVILTGMGDDGVIGAKAIKQLGGKVIVQDHATSTIYGMPKAVKEAGYADYELPLDQIVAKIKLIINNGS